MKIKKLMPMDAESRRLIDWMEKGETCPELIHCLLLNNCYLSHLLVKKSVVFCLFWTSTWYAHLSKKIL